MGKKRTDRQELLPGTLDMLILKTLSRQVMHGYGIAEHIRQVLANTHSIDQTATEDNLGPRRGDIEFCG